MHKNWPQIAKELSVLMGEGRKGTPEAWGAFSNLAKAATAGNEGGLGNADIDRMVAERVAAKKAKNFAEADRIRKELLEAGIVLEDTKDGTSWRRA